MCSVCPRATSPRSSTRTMSKHRARVCPVSVPNGLGTLTRQATKGPTMTISESYLRAVSHMTRADTSSGRVFSTYSCACAYMRGLTDNGFKGALYVYPRGNKYEVCAR